MGSPPGTIIIIIIIIFTAKAVCLTRIILYYIIHLHHESWQYDYYKCTRYISTVDDV